MRWTPSVVSHWHKLFGQYHTSVQEFYSLVEDAIRSREIPEATLSRVTWREGGILSREREYLRVSREKLNFDICAAPFGGGFFFSWWLARLPPGLEVIIYYAVLFGVAIGSAVVGATFEGCAATGVAFMTFATLLFVLGWLVRGGQLGSEQVVLRLLYFGPIYERIFQPPTYFRADSETMFQEAVHGAVIEVIESLTTAQGMRALTETERQPTLWRLRKRGDDEQEGPLAS